MIKMLFLKLQAKGNSVCSVSSAFIGLHSYCHISDSLPDSNAAKRRTICLSRTVYEKCMRFDQIQRKNVALCDTLYDFMR